MVRFVPFIAALLTLGASAGTPVRSIPEGEWTLLLVFERDVYFRLGAETLEVKLAYCLQQRVVAIGVEDPFRFILSLSMQPIIAPIPTKFKPNGAVPVPWTSGVTRRLLSPIVKFTEQQGEL